MENLNFTANEIESLLSNLLPLSAAEKDATIAQEILLSDPFAQGFDMAGESDLDELVAVADLIEQLFPHRA